MIVEDLERVYFEIFPCNALDSLPLPCCVLITTYFSFPLATVNFLAYKFDLVAQILRYNLFNCLAAGFYRLVLFYGHSFPFFILVTNAMTTLDTMTVGASTIVSGLDTRIVSIC